MIPPAPTAPTVPTAVTMPVPDDARADPPVVALLEECVLRMELEGSAVVDELCRAHPEHAGELRRGIAFLQREQMVEGDDGEMPERLGDFRLLRRLGGGGMGVVFLAEQISLQRQVAVKLVRPELLLFAGSRARFRREAEAIARLQHPGIVPVHATGELDGMPYFAMEYVEGASLAAVLTELAGNAPERLDGESLATALRRCTGRELPAPLPYAGSWWQVIGDIVLQLAGAVSHAHQRGVLHRDLKPSNVMMALDGRVQLVDFGLARSEGDAALTQSGTPLGSLAYMSPEQIEGRADLGVTTDVYALGVVLYELLALRSPFLSPTGSETRRRILDGELEPLRRLCRRVPADVATVCLQAMARDTKDRYQSVAAFTQDLGNALGSRPILARPPGPVARLARYARRHPARTALAAVLIVLLPLVSILLGNHLRNRDAVARGRLAAAAAHEAALL
ncbi:MAG: serine/threonine protein kinase, partial [Planctomycetes bacterium]|nr:serine/threonine protein kinase [Planctomycetota bacterium]